MAALGCFQLPPRSPRGSSGKVPAPSGLPSVGARPHPAQPLSRGTSSPRHTFSPGLRWLSKPLHSRTGNSETLPLCPLLRRLRRPCFVCTSVPAARRPASSSLALSSRSQQLVLPPEQTRSSPCVSRPQLTVSLWPSRQHALEPITRMQPKLPCLHRCPLHQIHFSPRTLSTSGHSENGDATWVSPSLQCPSVLSPSPIRASTPHGQERRHRHTLPHPQLAPPKHGRTNEPHHHHHCQVAGFWEFSELTASAPA